MIEYRPFQMPCLNLRCYFGVVGDNCELIPSSEVYRYPYPYQTAHFSLTLVEEKCGSTSTCGMARHGHSLFSPQKIDALRLRGMRRIRAQPQLPLAAPGRRVGGAIWRAAVRMHLILHVTHPLSTRLLYKSAD